MIEMQEDFDFSLSPGNELHRFNIPKAAHRTTSVLHFRKTGEIGIFKNLFQGRSTNFKCQYHQKLLLWFSPTRLSTKISSASIEGATSHSVIKLRVPLLSFFDNANPCVPMTSGQMIIVKRVYKQLLMRESSQRNAKKSKMS